MRPLESIDNTCQLRSSMPTLWRPSVKSSGWMAPSVRYTLPRNRCISAKRSSCCRASTSTLRKRGEIAGREDGGRITNRVFVRVRESTIRLLDASFPAEFEQLILCAFSLGRSEEVFSNMNWCYRRALFIVSVPLLTVVSLLFIVQVYTP